MLLVVPVRDARWRGGQQGGACIAGRCARGSMPRPNRKAGATGGRGESARAAALEMCERELERGTLRLSARYVVGAILRVRRAEPARSSLKPTISSFQ